MKSKLWIYYIIASAIHFHAHTQFSNRFGIEHGTGSLLFKPKVNTFWTSTKWNPIIKSLKSGSDK